MCPRQITRQDEGKLVRITNGTDTLVVRVFVVYPHAFTDIRLRRFRFSEWSAVSEGWK